MNKEVSKSLDYVKTVLFLQNYYLALRQKAHRDCIAGGCNLATDPRNINPHRPVSVPAFLEFS